MCIKYLQEDGKCYEIGGNTVLNNTLQQGEMQAQANEEGSTLPTGMGSYNVEGIVATSALIIVVLALSVYKFKRDRSRSTENARV